VSLGIRFTKPNVYDWATVVVEAEGRADLTPVLDIGDERVGDRPEAGLDYAL
jgi:hypothetical protein